MKLITHRAINAHAVSEYPRECCGLIIVESGQERYVACRNSATGTDHFILPAEDYAEAEGRGAIIAVVHSHPDVPATPSQADRVACETSGLAWHIVRVDLKGGEPVAGEMVTIEPIGYVAPLVGRVFSHGVLDCYQLIVDWYKQERDIVLKQFPRADDWWNDGTSDLYAQGFPQAGFVKIKEGDQPQLGDVILMQIRSENGVPNHAGIYIGDGLMLHHLYGRLSSRDIYGGVLPGRDPGHFAIPRMMLLYHYSMTTFGGVMQKLIVASILMLGLFGCVTTPTPADRAIPVPADRVFLYQQQPNAEFGTLIVTRDTGYAGSFCFIGVYVAGQLAAKLNPSETTKFVVPKGEVIIGVGGAGGAGTCGMENGFRREISSVVNSGEIKRFRIVIRPGDGAAIEPTTL